MSDDLLIPIVQEEAHVAKRAVEVGRVRVRTSAEEEQIVVRDEVRREQVELTRVPMDREVSAAPATRVEGDVTIVPVLEERLVVEKRLFLVEEIHLRRSVTAEAVAVPVTLRRTHVEVERTEPDQKEDH